jgi:hypothetical protein
MTAVWELLAVAPKDRMQTTLTGLTEAMPLELARLQIQASLQERELVLAVVLLSFHPARTVESLPASTILPEL